MLKKILLASAAILLSGCNSEFAVPVDLSLFDEKSSSQSQAELTMEITRCEDRETKKISQDLFKLKSQLPFVFEGSQFVSCEQKSFMSTAKFLIPINYDVNNDGKFVNNNQINLSYFSYQNTGPKNLIISIPPELQEKVQTLIDSEMFFDSNDLAINIGIQGNKEKHDLSLYGIYSGDHYLQVSHQKSVEINQVILRLPNAALNALLDEKIGGYIILGDVKISK